MNLSVAQAVREKQIPTIVVNDTFRLAPWADMLYACDQKWWLYHAEWALKFEGLKVTQDESVPFPQVLCVPNSGTYGFDPDPSRLRTGNNSGYQAVHIGIHAGMKRGLLFGFDMHGDHWFGKHPHQLQDADPGVFKRAFIPAFEGLVKLLPELGVEIINCTPGSALKCFPMMDLEAALETSALPNTARPALSI